MIALHRSAVLAGVRARARASGSSPSSVLARVGAETPTSVVVPASSSPTSVTVECADRPLRWVHWVGTALVVVVGVYVYKRYYA